MRKFFTILSVVSAFAFTSCDNENTVNPQPLGTVTIKGVVYADIDEDDEDNAAYEIIPTGVAIYAIDRNTGATLATTTTTASGYTLTIEVGGPRDIIIEVGDFATEINDYNAVEDDFEKKKAIYAERESALIDNVIKGATYIQDIAISQPEVTDYE